MRHYVAKLGFVFLVGSGGCSLIFNPDNISKVKPVDAKEYMDAPPPDTEIIADADHSMISVTGVFPPTINEGAGDDNSRPAIVALKGMNFEKSAAANLMVSVTGWTGIDVLDKKISTDGDYIVLALHVPVDETCASGTKTLTVTVTKSDGAGGMPSATLPDGMLAVTCLDELKAAPTDSIDPPPLYSRIAIATPIAYTAAAGKKPAILRAVSSIKIYDTGSSTAQDVDASASAQAPGPGGNAGGATGANGGGPGHGTGVTNAAGGGGAGFATAGTAGGTGPLGAAGGAAGAAQTPPDPWIASYATDVSSGGGGSTEVGGGGGGTLELSAGGDLVVGNVSAKGAAGTDAPTGITIADAGGGGGTGGVILLRSGGTITVGTTNVSGGGGGTGRGGGGSGGNGGSGRVRVDSAAGTIPASTQVGPMFTIAPTVTDSYPDITLRGLPNDSSATVKVFDYKGDLVKNMFNMTSYPVGFGMTATVATGTVSPALEIGYNKVCVLVAGNPDPNVAEGTNCIEIGYAP